MAKRKRVTRTKPTRRRKSSRRKKKQPFVNGKAFFALFCIIIGIMIFNRAPVSFRSVADECESLHKKIERKITERKGVFTAISKNYATKSFLGTKYRQGSFDLELRPGVEREKFWYGFEKDLVSLVTLKKKVRKESLTISLYKDKLLIAIITLTNAQQAPPVKSTSVKKKAVEKKRTVAKRVAKPAVRKPVPVRKEVVRQKTIFPRTVVGQVAFLIDDVGNTREYEDLYLQLPPEVTPAILPRLSYSKHFATLSKRRGHDVMLHLPLEAESAIYPGPGAIFLHMKESEVLTNLRTNLASVPYAIGVNNHMGSRGTQDVGIMRTILGELKGRGLFFLDSYTSANSVVYDVMQEMHMPYIKRSVFLDNKSDREYIRGQIRQLIAFGKKHKRAIGIGHYKPNTMRVIVEMIPEIEREGLEVVKVREFY